MVFSSPVFLFLFLPIVLGIYAILPRSARNAWLLAASLFFYLWGEKLYIFVLIASVAVNYAFGLCLDRCRARPRATHILVGLAVIANLGLLILYKYANFIIDNVNDILVGVGVNPLANEPIHLPLGISFFTFHALSYVIDVYRRQVEALKRPVDFALYIAFFPQSIAGPIVRYHELASQLTDRVATLAGVAGGIQRLIVGLAKKMILANAMAGPADALFGLAPECLTPGLAWLAVLCYTLQIYFDFSGYSDMAIGLAQMFGFEFPENFNYPYIARSITEFWRRWHISLSTWYRDYLYIPLGGNRRGTVRMYANLLIVFILCGFWHGASWTFLVWGLFHGAFLVLERAGLDRLLNGLPRMVRHGYTLLVVMVGWTFFRATSLAQALTMLQIMAGHTTSTSGTVMDLAFFFNREFGLLLIASLVCCVPVLPWLARARERLLRATGEKGLLGAACQVVCAFSPVIGLSVLLLVSTMLLLAGTYSPFIYFRF